MSRTIFHVDMDAFYASVEQQEHPEYRGKPVIVGADPKNGEGRGVVAACSYEARKFGIHSALPISRAFRLCPDGTYLRPDRKKYVKVSHQIRAIFYSYAERVEPLSIDEAFLDMSQRGTNCDTALEIAHSLKDTISDRHGLTASVGIAPNKFVAKIASDLEKPDGLVLVKSEEVQSFLDPLPISRLWGVGPKTEARLTELGVHTTLQLRHLELSLLIERFGKLGEHLWRLANGVDDRPVVQSREPKSIGHETTFSEDVLEGEILDQTLRRLTLSVCERLSKLSLSARTLTLKLRYSDFTTITRQVTMRDPICGSDDIFGVAHRLLKKFRDPRQKIRLIGVSVSSLESVGSSRQITLF